MIAVGLMSGTSLDGIDAALVDVVPRGDGYAVGVVRFQTFPFERALLEAMTAALPPNEGSVSLIAALHHALGEAFAAAAREVASDARPSFVASHGQTVWHDGARHVTLQLGDAFAIREATGATVCYDFRSADCAAGGHGAPLVPFVDALLFADAHEDRVALNLGGIANVTLLPRGARRDAVVAFDTGPGNMLLDALVRQRTNDAAGYDRDGALARGGAIDANLLDALRGDDYFSQEPPKTTGRERFGAHFLARYAERFSRLSIEDALATLTELTASTVADGIVSNGLEAARVLVSGGGAHNAALLERLAARLPRARVETSDTMGIPADAKEAVAFAVLGYETLRGRAANVPRATGAARPAVLGAIAPAGLPALLASVDAEVRAAGAGA